MLCEINRKPREANTFQSLRIQQYGIIRAVKVGYGEQIRRRREARGWNQTDLAHRAVDDKGVGLNFGTVSQAEREANPTMKTLLKIAHGLECDVRLFFTESPAELTNPRPSPSPAHVSSAEEEETPMTERDRLAAAVNAATQLLGDEVGPVVELILHIRKRAHMPQEGAVPPASAEDGSTV